jgi:uncharacterized membrane protein YgcG
MELAFWIGGTVIGTMLLVALIARMCEPPKEQPKPILRSERCPPHRSLYYAPYRTRYPRYPRHTVVSAPLREPSSRRPHDDATPYIASPIIVESGSSSFDGGSSSSCDGSGGGSGGGE